jgi:tRNA1(Val) A37 N6-methylase TrmN6
MLTQGYPSAVVDAIDVDEGAVQQTRQNIAATQANPHTTEWHRRIRVFHQSAQDFSAEHGRSAAGGAERLEYDLIVCAPPYFDTRVAEQQGAPPPSTLDHDPWLAEMDAKRRTARHTLTLTMADLVGAVTVRPLACPRVKTEQRRAGAFVRPWTILHHRIRTVPSE